MRSSLFNTKNTFRLGKALSLFILSLLLHTTAKAQTAPAWVQFGSPADYANYDVQEVAVGLDTVGNVYTSGTMYDTINNLTRIVLMKYNSTGALQWSSSYDNANLSANDKHIVVLLVDKAGNCYLCGYGRTNSGSTSKDYLIIKYNNAGIQQWVKTYDGGQSDWDYITCATFDAAGNIVVGGYVNDNGGSTGDDIGIVKYSTSGSLLWSYQYNNVSSNQEDRALGIASDINNNIYVTGSTYVTNARNLLVLKLNSAGVNQWTKITSHVNPSNDERGYSITADASGNCYVTGAAGDWITMKYDPNGTVLWTNHYTQYTLNSDNPKKVMLDKNNDVIIAGDVYVGSNNSSDLSVSKLANATGTSLWTVTKNNTSTDYFTDAALDDNGNVYVSGYFSGALAKDISGMILSGSGSILWNGTYSNSAFAGGADLAFHVAVDKSHNFYLAGLSERRNSSSNDGVDIVTLKYNALVTGIAENKLALQDLQIYPNPAKDKLMVRLNGEHFSETSISICTINGELIKQEMFLSYPQVINIEQFPAGIYLIKVVGQDGIAIGKFIKE